MLLTASMLAALTMTLGSTAATGDQVATTWASATFSLAAPAPAEPQATTRLLRPAPKVDRWMVDARVSRPAMLPALYATLGGLQALDVYSTRRALGAGSLEANPLMKAPAKNSGAMMAVKVLSTVGSIYFTERAWKKNRKGALILMAALNGVSAAVTARNIRNAQR